MCINVIFLIRNIKVLNFRWLRSIYLHRYIMLNISLYFIKPDNTYVLIWSFQYGPLEPCWFLKDSESENIWLMKLIDIVIFWLKINVKIKSKRRRHILREWFLPYFSCRLLGSTSSLVEQPTQSILPETETLSLMFSTVIAWSLDGASLTRLRYTRSAPEIYPCWYLLNLLRLRCCL